MPWVLGGPCRMRQRAQSARALSPAAPVDVTIRRVAFRCVELPPPPIVYRSLLG